MSSLQHTLSYILEDDQSSPKIPRVRLITSLVVLPHLAHTHTLWRVSPQLLLLVKSMKYVDEEIVAVFHVRHTTSASRCASLAHAAAVSRRSLGPDRRDRGLLPPRDRRATRSCARRWHWRALAQRLGLHAHGRDAPRPSQELLEHHAAQS